MKYSRLTKEQFEALQQEFINFLATQSITAKEWLDIKTNKPELAEQELDIFSDLIWEGVLSKAQYLENISSKHLYLFYLAENNMQLIGLKLVNTDQDLTTSEGFNWLRDHLLSDNVELFQSKKEYSNDRQLDKFTLIQQGASITKGELFKYFETLIG